MKALTLGAALAVAACLSACSSIPGMSGGNGSQLSDALLKIASDPSCGHDDELHVILGPVPSGSVDLKRQCAAQGASTSTPGAK